MKFLARINRNFLVLFTVILLGITVAGYFALRVIITRGAKEKLLSKEYLIESQIRNTGEMPNLQPVIEVQKTDREPVVKPSFRDVVIRNEMEKEDERFLEYSNKIQINGIWYTVNIRQSSFENEDLILILVLTLFILLSSAFIISFFLTRRLNRTVWADFEHTLHEIESFSLNSDIELSLLRSETEEFERLNNIVSDFTRKLKSDYSMLKEFTENTSHEIRTPVSIALLNLEEILQQDVKEETFQKAVTSINALKRLSALNQSLSLLAKIENKQFIPDKEISFNEIISRKAEELSTLFDSKDLKLMISGDQEFSVRMNEYLAESLINNLLSNAVNHNIKGGTINILIQSGFFRICNTGENNSLTSETIFNRFVSGNPRSSGLGLAIVKKICETHNLDIHYMKDELHCFVIRKKT